MPQTMSYAQALNEAKQLIIQQANRIKADGEKLRLQQQTIAEQATAIAHKDARIKEDQAALEAQMEEIRGLGEKLDTINSARQQAEMMATRHGDRINNLLDAVAELERRTEQQAQEISDLVRQRDDLQCRLPTQEDIDALVAMTALLAKRTAGAAPSGAEAKTLPQMRLAEAA